MDLMTLDANNQPAKLIENYDSLLWTERFNTVGDFQLVTGNVGPFLTMLPEGMRVTLRETNEVMVVETHRIDRKKNAPETLMISGRSFESILDRRVAIPSVSSLTGSTGWTVSVKTPSDAAYFAIERICVEGIVDPADIFEAAMVQFPTPADYFSSSGPTKPFDIPRGNLLSVVLDLIGTEVPTIDVSTTPNTPAIVPHGIRAVRPNFAGTAVAIQIYPSVDRSASIYFDSSRDMLDDGAYIFSKVGSGNAAYGVGPSMAVQMYEGTAKPTGLNRRVILIDATESGAGDVEVLRYNMSQSLSEAHETALFDGSINKDLHPYKYGVDYGLGDIVTVKGDYIMNAKYRVTEYIRSEDATGDKAYPTLDAIPTA